MEKKQIHWEILARFTRLGFKVKLQFQQGAEFENQLSELKFSLTDWPHLKGKLLIYKYAQG